MLSSANGTPALEMESKTVTSSSDSKEVTMEPEERKPKVEDDPDLRQDFDLAVRANPARPSLAPLADLPSSPAPSTA